MLVLHRKFVGEAAEPFIVTLRRNMDGRSVNDPLATITAGASHQALAMPFVVKYHGGVDPQRDGSERSCDVRQPLPTVDTQPRFAVVAPFFLPRAGFHDAHQPDKPPPRSVERPLPTLIAADSPGRLIVPFLTKYHGTGGAESVDVPLSTLTTKHRHGLAMVELLKTMQELNVVDVGFRMLDVDELAAAQGFPAGYILHGNKADQIRQVGNAVCPGVMKAICEAIAA